MTQTELLSLQFDDILKLWDRQMYPSFVDFINKYPKDDNNEV